MILGSAPPRKNITDEELELGFRPRTLPEFACSSAAATINFYAVQQKVFGQFGVGFDRARASFQLW